MGHRQILPTPLLYLGAADSRPKSQVGCRSWQEGGQEVTHTHRCSTIGGHHPILKLEGTLLPPPGSQAWL